LFSFLPVCLSLVIHICSNLLAFGPMYSHLFAFIRVCSHLPALVPIFCALPRLAQICPHLVAFVPPCLSLFLSARSCSQNFQFPHRLVYQMGDSWVPWNLPERVQAVSELSQKSLATAPPVMLACCDARVEFFRVMVGYTAKRTGNCRLRRCTQSKLPIQNDGSHHLSQAMHLRMTSLLLAQSRGHFVDTPGPDTG
jgi:hypothetical protein